MLQQNFPKNGSHYDLPIALAILVGSGQLRQSGEHCVFAGELALNGDSDKSAVQSPSLRPLNKWAIKPRACARNTPQASLVSGIDIIGVKNLKGLFLPP